MDNGRCRSFVATPLINLRSYAYVMKQADKKAVLGGPSSDETLPFNREKIKF